MKKIKKLWITFLMLFLYASPVLHAQVLSTITTSTTISTQICLPATLNVNFTTNGNANGGNIFTAQLSDGSGSFANPRVIGTLSSTIAGSISCYIADTIPVIPFNYLIRVVSSSPAITGTDNGLAINFAVRPASISALSGPTTVCGNSHFSVSATSSGLSNTFWQIGINYLSYTNNGFGATIFTGSVNAPQTGSIIVSNYNSFCGSSSPPFQITEYPSQQAAFNASGPTTFCQGDSTVLTSTNIPDGGSLSFDGIDDYVSMPNQPYLGRHFTEEAWIYCKSLTDNAYHGIIGNSQQQPQIRPPSLYVYNGTDIHGGFGDGASWHYFTAPNVIRPNTWNLISMTFDSITLILYVNGDSVFSTTAFSGILPYQLRVNRIGGLDYFFNGKIDEVRLWNVARTQAQIRQGMVYVLPTEPGLNSYYKMNEGTGNTIGNASGNLIAATRGALPAKPVWDTDPAPTGYLWSNGERTPSVNIKTSGSYSLTFTNTYGCSTSTYIPTSVTVNPLPVVTTGNPYFCAGYIIQLTGNPSGGTVNVLNPYTGPSTAYIYTYTDANGCKNSANGYVTAVQPASSAGPLVVQGGISNVCPGETKTFTVDSLLATFVWSVPTGASILSGQGTFKVKVKFNSGFINSDSVRVTVTNNTCGLPGTFSIYLKRNDPAQPSTITGNNYGVCNQNGVPCSVTKVNSMTYNWSYSNSNAAVSTGQGTKAITADYGTAFVSGTLSVTAQNACGISLVRTKAIYSRPAIPASITGSASVCVNQSGVAYSIASLPGALNYTWTGPPGSQISDGINTASTLVTSSTSVTVDYGLNGGTLKVRGNNNCAFGSYKTKTIGITCREVEIGFEQNDFSVVVFPNPASGKSTIELNLTNDSKYNLKMFDALGKTVLSSSADGFAGDNQFPLNLHDISPGIYLISIEVNGISKLQKIVVQ